MKMHTFFECEKCGRVSSSREEIVQCEAAHWGLTVVEKQEWERLKDDVVYRSCIVSYSKNPLTERDFDEAIRRVMSFEKQHGIED